MWISVLVAHVNIIRIITATGRRESMRGEVGLLSNVTVLVSMCIILSLNDAVAPSYCPILILRIPMPNGNPGE